MSEKKYVGDALWSILVNTVHSMVMYPHHKVYVRSVVLHERPNISAQELSISIGISFGEALVILHELNSEKDD